MPAIIFSHEELNDKLVVETGANQISWSYNLNTAVYPTYAGEVVQILSTNIDVLRIQGEVKTTKKMEEIYKWFLKYMQIATQGFSHHERYTEVPVVMEYPERGWTLRIQPMALPALRYGRDVVIPQWSMQAHIVDPDPEQAELTLDMASTLTEMYDFTHNLTAEVGFRQGNPYSDPLGLLTAQEHELFPKYSRDGKYYEGQDAPAYDPGSDLEGIAKQLSKVVEAYISKDFGGVEDIIRSFTTGEASKPADPQKSDKDSDDADQEKSSKKRER